ncbi:MATE family efflux transporter [soil metagenome]
MEKEVMESPALFLNPLDMNVSSAFRMALPLVATSLVFCLIGAVDMALAGCKSAAAQAAVGVADQCIFATMLVGTGLSAATGCFVSQSIGAKNLGLARQYAIDGIVFAALFGSLASLICFCSAETLIKFFGCSPASRVVALPYLQICAFGNLPFMVVIVQAAILRAIGKTADCLRMWTLIGLVSIAGGLGLYMVNGLPCSQSMTSLAVAWDLGALAGVVFASVILSRTFFSRAKSSLCNPKRLPSQAHRLLEFSRVGIPVLLSEACSIASLAAVYAIIGRLPGNENLQAAYTVTLKIEETFGILPLVAMSTVSATLIGHQVGAKMFATARTLGWQLAIASTGIMLICGIFVREASPALAAFFTADMTVLSAIGIGTASANVSMPLIAFTFVLFANLEGVGKTTLPLAAQFAGYIACRIPLAYIFAIHMDLGYTGVWLAIIVSRVVMAVLALLIYRCGFTADTLSP